MMRLPGWKSEPIDGLNVEWFEPSLNPRFTILFLHPFGGEMPSVNRSYTDAFRRAGIAVCAPFGGQSWWADRFCPDWSSSITAERFLLDRIVPAMLAKWNLGPGAIAVAGISMGGQGAVRLGFKYAAQFPIVASVAGAFDYHEWYGRGTTLDTIYRSREACRQDTAILHLHPAKYPTHIRLACDPADEWFRGNDRLHEKLNAIGIPHETDFVTTLGGHGWTFFDAMAAPTVEWCLKALEKESRRLI
jgi:S-formylglutathione hydrolase